MRPFKLRAPRIDQAQIRFAVKTALAAVLTMGAAQLLGLPQGYWGVISVIVVMQSNIGNSLQACWNRILGTALGAVMGALSVSLLGTSPWSLGLALFATTLVCAYLTVLHASFRLAGLTASIVIFLGENAPWHVGFTRFSEIAIGVLMALVVSFALWPSQARAVLRHGLATSLKDMGRLLDLVVGSRMEGAYQRMPIFHLKEQLLRLSARNRQLLRAARSEPGAGMDDEILSALSRFEERLMEHILAMDHAAEISEQDELRPLPPELAGLARAMSSAMAELAEAVSDRTPPASHASLDAALAKASDKVAELREAHIFLTYGMDEILRFYQFFNSMKEAAREITLTSERLHEAAEENA